MQKRRKDIIKLDDTTRMRVLSLGDKQIKLRVEELRDAGAGSPGQRPPEKHPLD